ncbi:MAG: glycine/sarcosine/betaine reductase selenoprotein B family protein [Enterocloster bolteae]
MACGNILKICSLKGIPAFSGMYPENPGAEMFRYIRFYYKNQKFCREYEVCDSGYDCPD